MDQSKVVTDESRDFSTTGLYPFTTKSTKQLLLLCVCIKYG